jgi:C_GCAxxG_C_C family probable redox protein
VGGATPAGREIIISKTTQLNIPENQDISRLVGAKAQELFSRGRMLCAPAVLTALNLGLGGGLEQPMVNNLTAGLGEGLGGAGCLCGAVSGACVGLGLFMGSGKDGGRASRRVAEASHQLHDSFKAERGSTCCRVLSRKVKDDKKAHMAQCAELSGLAAELACRAILLQRPELAQTADLDYLSQKVAKKSGLARLATAVSV